MPITLGSNISSLQAQRRLSQSSDTAARAYERLSSGMRVNRASDDAAGLAIAMQLRTDARVMAQSIRNVSDGISLLSIAQGALTELSGIVMRQKELAQQAANGTYSSSQRRALDKEAEALVKEYNRIVQSAKFNGQYILDGSYDSVRLQHGVGAEQSTLLSIGQQMGVAAGDGTFATPYSVYLGPGVAGGGVTLSDVNQDGNLDLLVGTNLGFEGVQVHLGNGDGSFKGTPFVLAESFGGYSVQTADFDEDGKIDILDGNGEIFFGNGDGTFKFVDDGGGLFGNANTYIVRDMNNDGHIDVVGGGVLHLNNGDGTFRVSASMAISSSNDRFDVNDLNNDGYADIVIGNYGNARADIFLSNGNGTFRIGAALATDAQPYDIHLEDLNNDGNLDLITAHAGSDRLDIFLGNGDGSFYARQSVAVISPTGITTGDYNGDGIADIAMMGYTGRIMTILIGNGNGTFGAGVTSDGVEWAFASVSADINNDDILDLAYVNFASEGAYIALGNADPSGRRNNQISSYDLTTLVGAREALQRTTEYLSRINLELASLGSAESRAQSVLNNLVSTRENYIAAESRIMDADVAQESANLARAAILQQAAAAVLAQANLQPHIALQLLSLKGDKVT